MTGLDDTENESTDDLGDRVDDFEEQVGALNRDLTEQFQDGGSEPTDEHARPRLTYEASKPAV